MEQFYPTMVGENMITPIVVQLLGTPTREGGRRDVIQSYPIDVFWNENLSKYRYNDRIMNSSPSAEVIITFEEDLPPMDPEIITILKDNKIYRIVDRVDNLLSPIGVDGTYSFLVSELREYT